ncbi:MAG: hypothetical protein J5598_00840, partial [Clostridia bacterium]|nr:hypothetical protein [Clostridia bacterium]
YLTISRTFIITTLVTVLIFTIFYFIRSKASACIFLSITLVAICAIGGIFWNVTKVYFEKIADQSGITEVYPIDVNTVSNSITEKYVNYFDNQSPEWQQDTLVGKNHYDPGRLGLQELYLRDWSSSAKNIWLGRGVRDH